MKSIKTITGNLISQDSNGQPSTSQGKLMQVDQSSTTRQTTGSTRLELKIKEIWDVLARKYRNRFESGFVGDDRDLAMWAMAIKGLTPRQVDDGIRAVVMSNDNWPPTHEGFRMLCLGIDENYKRKLFDLATRWRSLTNEELIDNDEFRRVQWIIRSMSANNDAYLFKTAGYKEVAKLFGEYLNKCVMIPVDDLEPIALRVEDNSYKPLEYEELSEKLKAMKTW